MSQELKLRTKNFAFDIIKFTTTLPDSTNKRLLCNQLFRSATSVGANYRAACRARSRAEFYAKIRIVLEEADECCYWLELIIESNLTKDKKAEEALKEANELTAIFVAISKSRNKF